MLLVFNTCKIPIARSAYGVMADRVNFTFDVQYLLVQVRHWKSVSMTQFKPPKRLVLMLCDTTGIQSSPSIQEILVIPSPLPAIPMHLPLCWLWLFRPPSFSL